MNSTDDDSANVVVPDTKQYPHPYMHIKPEDDIHLGFGDGSNPPQFLPPRRKKDSGFGPTPHTPAIKM